MLKIAVVLTLCISAVVSIILCTETTCSKTVCPTEPTRESCEAKNGRYEENGGLCDCCQNCIERVGEGEFCSDVILKYIPTLTECDKGLYCDQINFVCKKKTCSMTVQDLASNIQSSASRPTCSADGNYTPKQCDSTRCWCVEKDGSPINGFSAPVNDAADMLCTCARDQAEHEKQGAPSKGFRCTPKGNYDSIQCDGRQCYCADPVNGKQLDGSDRLPFSRAILLSCGNQQQLTG